MRYLAPLTIFSLLLGVIAPETALAQKAIIVTSATEKDLLNALPPPQASITPHKLLTLQEAIILALRNNPTVHSSRLSRLSAKFALELADYTFLPRFHFSASASLVQGQKTGYNVNPGIDLDTRFGTHITVENTSNLNGTQRESVTVKQPLLGGFGFVNEIPWLNAQDNEFVARQNFKVSIMEIVTDVTSNYRQVVQDYNSLEAQERSLKRVQETAKQYELRVKSGKMAPSELLQQQSTLAGSELETERAKTSAEQDYQTLLDTLGLSPQSKLKLDTHINFRSYRQPGLQESIDTALNNNPAYLIQKMGLNATRRAVISAKDKLRWRLDFTGTANFESSPGTAGIIDNFNQLSLSDKPTANFELSIPILDFSSKVDLIDAKITLAQAEDSLEQGRRTLIREVTNAWNNLKSQRKQLLIAEQGLELQKKNLEAERIKQQYGQTTALSVNIIQDTLLSQELDFINSQISYLNSVTAFEKMLGNTLKDWNIQIRY